MVGDGKKLDEMNAVEKENVASDVTETEMNLMYLYAIEFLNNS